MFASGSFGDARFDDDEEEEDAMDSLIHGRRASDMGE